MSVHFTEMVRGKTIETRSSAGHLLGLPKGCVRLPVITDLVIVFLP